MDRACDSSCALMSVGRNEFAQFRDRAHFAQDAYVPSH